MKLELKIREQGAPRVRQGWIYRKGDSVIAIEIDLHSKYCQTSGSSSDERNIPGLLISTSNDSLYLDDTKERDEDTWIEFPQFAGWSVWCHGVGRYTLTVCLTRNNAEA